MKPKSKKIKIIIADDHPIFRDGMEAAIKNMPMVGKVVKVESGDEVINLLNEESFDIVFMDIIMKPMDGIKATEIISNKFPEVKIIAISMRDDAKAISDIIDKGAVGYLIKNADKDEIQKAIEEVQAGREYYSIDASRLFIDRFKHKEGKKSDFQKEKNLDKERYREVLFLLCHDFTSIEIGKTISIAWRSVQYYREQLKELTGHQKVFGMVSYAKDNGILDDVELNRKFTKQLAKKKAFGKID